MDLDGTLEAGEKRYFMLDERWRVVGAFLDADDDAAKESFVAHAAGSGSASRFGQTSYIDSVILRDRDNTNGGWGTPDGTLEERRFYCQNWRADVVAITQSD